MTMNDTNSEHSKTNLAATVRETLAQHIIDTVKKNGTVEKHILNAWVQLEKLALSREQLRLKTLQLLHAEEKENPRPRSAPASREPAVTTPPISQPAPSRASAPAPTVAPASGKSGATDFPDSAENLTAVGTKEVMLEMTKLQPQPLRAAA